MRRYNKGWRQESERHSLAARGVPTGKQQKNAEFMKEFNANIKSTEQKNLRMIEEEKKSLLNDKEAVEAYEFEGKIIQIFPDQDPESPREWDNLGHIVAFHSRYDLGDKGEALKSSQFDGWNELEDYLEKERGAVVVIPVYLYDHSGLRLSTGDFGDRWDSGQVGFIYATKDDLMREYKSTNADAKKSAAAILRGEIETYDKYVSGDVYGYVVTDPKSGKSDSVWGFYGLKDAKEQAQDAARGMK